MEPFASFGMMFQELLGHRTVYSRQEVHNIRDTGVVVNVRYREQSCFYLILLMGLVSERRFSVVDHHRHKSDSSA